MSRATPQMQDLAARLITYETKVNKSAESNLPATFYVCERLRPHLATLMGHGGFRAVLTRALAVARTEVPWLAMVEVNADGSFEGWDKPEAQLTPKVRAEGGVLLVSHLLGLLVAFIGENLTLRLLCEVWPKLALNDLKSPKKNHP